jgi:hypothetical protein
MRNKENHAKWARVYRRTLKGFLESKYTAMQKRVNGQDRNCLKTVAGLPIIPRNQFYIWARQQTSLYTLFWTYECSGWQFKLCPTIDRIDPTKRYIIGNMRFITQSENAKGAAWNRPRTVFLSREEVNKRARESYRLRRLRWAK